jgi:GNAT superfamily N-acetyltransferase
MRIRDATAADEAGFRALWAAYLAFYDMSLDSAVTDQTWARILDPASPMSARLAVDEAGAVLGFAVWHHHIASWHLANDLYLEDLFVDPAARGAGLGRALLDDLFALARTRGFGRIYWHTDEGNARARSLYDSYAPADGHIRYRLKL